MGVIRTPEERFTNLVGYPFQPHYMELDGMRLHYVDEGAGDPILCLHGEPSWSYLYRKMIPTLKNNNRVVAPDFLGFGKSDKFTEIGEYTYDMHKTTLMRFIEKLDLKNITIVVQDWGGLVGLRVVSLMPERFARLVIMNTGLPTDNAPFAFHLWRAFAKYIPNLPIGAIIRAGTSQMGRMPKEVVDAYNAPFPGKQHKVGAKAWPLMVPIKSTDPVASEMREARQFLKSWTKPCLVMFSDGDPITRGWKKIFREMIPSAKEQPEIVIAKGGHFLQEDKGEEIADRIVEFIGRSPLPRSETA